MSCNRCVDPMTNKKGRCVFENGTPSSAYKSVGKGRNAANTSIPGSKKDLGDTPQHGRSPDRIVGNKEVHPVRDAGDGRHSGVHTRRAGSVDRGKVIKRKTDGNAAIVPEKGRKSRAHVHSRKRG